MHVALPIPHNSFAQPWTTSSNFVIAHPAGYHPAVLTWWRKRPPLDFCEDEAEIVRQAVAEAIDASRMCWWSEITVDVAIAVGVGINRMKMRNTFHPEIDIALSAVLAFAIEGNAAAAVVISSGLRRRAHLDPRCYMLGALWLAAEGITIS